MSKLKIISRAKAKALGLTRYYSGKACPHGHVCERLVCSLGAAVLPLNYARLVIL
jgi:hypothetical protein